MRSDSTCSSPTTSEHPNRRNILIVGDVGVGKSSLVNLIAGEDRATTSSGAKSCTLHSQEYIVPLDGVEFALHDTAGLHEAQGNMKPAEYLDAIYQAYALISRLERSGGISLLVFCMKGGRISITTQQTYNLFVDVLCNRQVPVVIAVTHLEMHDCMEEWWRENEHAIKEYGLKSHGHACITTTRGYRNVFSDKYEQSEEIIRKHLLEYSGRVTWKEEKASWVKRVMLHMRVWMSPRRLKRLDSSDLRRKLIKRCGFSVEDAELVSQKIEQSRRMSGDAPGEDKSWFDEKFGTDSSSYVSLPVVSYTS
ncbi:P-loop containing nucleoside triphosphate hydrolase protein [Lanmaoa asiatica]|nr:P-loop containing nucleoside triphosphate hydrolase protein [Lanmaoa asiatica]